MKKKKKFVELDAKYFTEKKPLIIITKKEQIQKKENNFIRDISLLTLPNISFYVVKKAYMTYIMNYHYYTIYSFYNKENFKLIKEFISQLNNLEIMNENAIILYDHSIIEIWIKNKSNIFIKNKTINTTGKILSNILINSNSSLLLYAETGNISIWYIKDNIPRNKTAEIKVKLYHDGRDISLFFINNEDLFGVRKYNENSFLFIYFFKMKDFSIVKKLDIAGELIKIYRNLTYSKIIINKINENKLICVFTNPSEKETIFATYKIPEFIIEGRRKNKKCFFSDFSIYKNYILCYSWDRKIKVFETNKCKLVQEINMKGFCSMIHLKDNYLLGLMRESPQVEDLKTIVIFQINL